MEKENMENYYCMDLCKGASTDKWRQCLSDCYSKRHSNAVASLGTTTDLLGEAQQPTASRANNMIEVGVAIIAVTALAYAFLISKH